MPATFNPVRLDELTEFLQKKPRNFSPLVIDREIVFERRNHIDPKLIVRVFTSCSVNGSSVVRAVGQDAIRVVLVGMPAEGQGELVGIAKAKRVNRVGTTQAILDRLQSRMREMYKMASVMARGPRCACGAPRYPHSGRCVLNCY
jgi:hypothetical protein